MPKKIENILIVGGGTAGWMTAAYLNKAFDNGVQISLVESAVISTIGVGEATFSTIKLFFDFLGLDERDWMPKCDAAYKLAIKFVDWNAEKQHFYHPFQRYEIVDGFNIVEWWLKLKEDLKAYDYSCFPIPAMCESKKSPRFLDESVFDDKVKEHFKPERAFQKNALIDLKIQHPYAYHFNAALLAKFLRDFAKQNGVKHVLDDVTSVQLAEDGSIASITTKEHGDISADLYIDCTGFRGVLINKALGEPFIPFCDSLLCDSAIAMQIPRDVATKDINPYTTATALSAGWVWNIPLYGRDGTGYVYSSAFKSQEDAEKEFRAHLGSASDQLSPLHIKMRIGRSRNSWVKNCVAIGLSSGFVEPLESTGIFFIQHGIEQLVADFPDKSFNEELVKSYNKAIGNCIDGIRDFLTLHYYASSRCDTPFWQAAMHELVIPETLKDYLPLWKMRLPNNRNINQNYHGFESYSYSVMLLGLGYRPECSLPALNHMTDQKAWATFRAIKERTDRLCRTLPSQYEYLTAMRLDPPPVVRQRNVVPLISPVVSGQSPH
jgi:tryptophan halogenase